MEQTESSTAGGFAPFCLMVCFVARFCCHQDDRTHFAALFYSVHFIVFTCWLDLLAKPESRLLCLLPTLIPQLVPHSDNGDGGR
jgi:hypothetical protein